jgi:hypothetical protein
MEARSRDTVILTGSEESARSDAAAGDYKHSRRGGEYSAIRAGPA